MKILQICHKPPYPDTDGGTMASYSIARSLHEAGHHIEIFSLSTAKHPEREVSDSVLTKIKMHYSFADTRVKPSAAFKSLFEKHSYHLSRFYSDFAAEKLRKVLENKSFDVVVFESLYTAVYLPLVRAVSAAACIYREHNIESSLWKQRATKMKLPAKTVLHRFNQKLTKFEFEVINDFDGIAYISKTDAEILKGRGIDIPGIYIPFSYYPQNTDNQNEIETVRGKIGFIGSLNWDPNIEGIQRFLRNVWPGVHRQHPAAEFHIAGRGYNSKLTKLKTSGVYFSGEVKSAPDFMKSCSMLVVPLYESSGVRVKIVEASALGVPVITTPAGAKGLDMPEDAIAVCESDAYFSKEISRMLTNETHRKTRGKKAREHTLKTHHPAKTAKDLSLFIERLIN